MSEESMVALRRAVNLARERGIRTVAQLRVLLSSEFPPQVVNDALFFWAAHARRSGDGGGQHG